MPRVYSKRKGAQPPPPDAVYVGRPSKWGNPYQNPSQSRQQKIELFRTYAQHILKTAPNWVEPLRGKDLVCWCAPLPCHADVLLELANPPEEA